METAPALAARPQSGDGFHSRCAVPHQRVAVSPKVRAREWRDARGTDRGDYPPGVLRRLARGKHRRGHCATCLRRTRKVKMPHVIVKLWPGKSESQKARLAEKIVQDVMEALKITFPFICFISRKR